MIKDTIQLALASHEPVEEAIRKMLSSYHITPNAVSGVAPFTSLKGRNPGSKLTPNWLNGGALSGWTGNPFLGKLSGTNLSTNLDTTRNGVLSTKNGTKVNGW